MSLSNSPATGPGVFSAPPTQKTHPKLQWGGPVVAALLLAATVAALAVAANSLMSSWSDEHLLATWVALWALVFASSLLLSGATRRAAQSLMTKLDRWAHVRADARAQARALLLARHDPRLMAELQAALDRAEAQRVAAVRDGQLAPSGLDSCAVGAPQGWASSGTTVIDLGGRYRALPWYV